MVKQGRSKGLGVVMLTQTIRDLPEVLTHANVRILLRILEGEIQAYGAKQLYCQFRPTPSLPRGIEDFSLIREYSKSRVDLEKFTTQIASSQTSPRETLPKPELAQSPGGPDLPLTKTVG